jgi:NADH pyrophosphatase NudC (nudix superfamily)
VTARLVRPLAIGIITQGDCILVGEGYDPLKPETFYRPLGGGIEFGERAGEALSREVREEIGAEITDLRYLGTLENLFTFMGEPGHEIVLVIAARFADAAWYDLEAIPGHEDNGLPFQAMWKSLSDFQPGGLLLYPEGLLELLRDHGWTA